MYGQPDFINFSCNQFGVSASSLCHPWGIDVDANGSLFVSDFDNHRVLAYFPGDTVADRVYGQANFITATPNAGDISAGSLFD